MPCLSLLLSRGAGSVPVVGHYCVSRAVVGTGLDVSCDVNDKTSSYQPWPSSKK